VSYTSCRLHDGVPHGFTGDNLVVTKAKSKKKLFVLDTNVLLHDPNCLTKFHEHDLYLPFVTLEELDNHKVGTQDINRNARQVTRLLNDIVSQPAGSFAKGFELKHFNGKQASGRLFVQATSFPAIADLELSSKNDHQFLLAMAHLPKAHRPARDVVLVTKDLNLRIKAQALGFVAQDYLHDHAVTDADLLRKGIHYLDTDILETGRDLKSWKDGPLDYFQMRMGGADRFFVNELLVLPGGAQLVVRDNEKGVLTLSTMVDYTRERHALWGIRARNEEQSFAMNLLMDPEVDFITLLGPAGTGKTLLTLAAALQQVIETKRFGEIIFTRATVPMGEEIGFLPGTEEEKMRPWLGALEDNLDVLMKNARGDSDGGKHAKGDDSWQRDTTRQLVESHISVKSVSFMRGRTFQDKLFIVDEAQNLTPKQMKALVTRAGQGTKVVCMGNLAQIDTPYLSETSSGLAFAVERFKGWRHFGHLILEKGERSRLANYANEHL
jgi:PhoH-like ATPase